MVETGISAERRSVLVISMLRDRWKVSDDPGEEIVWEEEEERERRNGDGGRSAETDGTEHFSVVGDGLAHSRPVLGIVSIA